MFTFLSFLTTTITWSLLWSVLLGIPTARRGLNRNGFGICRGFSGDPGKPEFTDWLHTKIQEISGRKSPLTFQHLKENDIALEMVTSDLNYSRPVRLPFDPEQPPDGGYFFEESEWEKWFPRVVVEACIGNGKMGPPIEFLNMLPPAHRNRHFFKLPAQDLPILVAARMSLSFPVFISGVPVYSYDKKRGEIVKHWFSDGGISSNFPIHFFDTWMPNKPTFGLTLPPHQRDEEYVFMPESPEDEVPARAASISDLGGFLGQILDTMQNWRDTAQMSMPGYRERVCHIRLDPWEGGMNISMGREVITGLVERGQRAGEKITNTFGPEEWRQHLLTRYLSLMRNILKGLTQLSRSFDGTPPDPENPKECLAPYHFEQFLAGGAPCAKSYRGDRSTEWYENAANLTSELAAKVDALLGLFDETNKTAKDQDFPSPEPVLRSTSRM